jgi:DNA-binding CsgD family transcriptional regulator/tetratricopeptide (TPR) repeat protein
MPDRYNLHTTIRSSGAVMDSAISAADTTAGRPGSSSLRSPPLLVGREQEQDILRAELATAIAGQGRLILLGGEAGIGKTTLASDLSRDAATLGCRVLAGHCFDLTNTPPYGPWLDLFESSQPLPELPAPPAAFAGGALAAVTDQAALFADVRRFLAELTANVPTLILLEDLHWADQASVDLLRHVGPHLRHWPLMVLATYRADELARDHPLSRQLPALVREADGFRLDLRRLDPDALRALIRGRYRLARQDEDRLVTYLERHAEGNPFFATELLRTLEERGLLSQDGDRWSLGELDRVFVPSLLRQLIDGRVAHLGEATRQPLAMAAVIGQEVPLALWAEVAEIDEEDVLDVVERAVEAHLLEAERDGTRVHFVHALTREALYEGILPPRRRVWHRRVAETLLAIAEPDPDAVAYHLQQAGDPRAREWLIKAGDRAQRAYAWVTAAERLQEAAALLEGVEGEERTWCRLACRIGYLKRFSDLPSAIAVMEVAERVAARIGDTAIAAQLACARGGLLCYVDQFRAGCAEIDRGLAALEAMPFEAAQMSAAIPEWFDIFLPTTSSIDAIEDERAIARLHAAGLHFRQCTYRSHHAAAGYLGSAVDADEQFVALVDEPGARGRMPAGAAFAYHELGIVHAAMGRPDAARRAWTRSRELFSEYDHHALVVFTLLGEMRDVALTYGAAEPAARRRLAAEAEAALGRAGGALRQGVSPRLAWLGCLALDGRWDEALRILDDLPAPGNAYLRREVTDTRAVLARRRGEPEVAWAQIRPLFLDGPATEPGDHIHQEGLFLQRLAADLCLDAGDLAGARAWLEAHDAWLAWSGSVLGRADGKMAWARYQWASGDVAEARAVAEDARALAAMPHQPLVWLAVHRLLGEIDTAAGVYGAAEGHLAAALELAAACEAPFERSVTLLAMAELRAATGDASEAATLLNEVRQICIQLGAAPTLARAEALAARLSDRPPGEHYPAGLTEREVEVLRLLPRGLSNAEIAAELFVSPRTVQTHLTNLYGKLGVGGRAEAVAFAMAHGLV